jgi:hypothetical protein
MVDHIDELTAELAFDDDCINYEYEYEVDFVDINQELDLMEDDDDGI